MKSIQIGIIFLSIIMIFSTVSLSEVVQLIDESYEVKKDNISNYTVEELAEIQSIKKFIITFVQASPETQSELLTAKFRESHKNPSETILYCQNYLK